MAKTESEGFKYFRWALLFFLLAALVAVIPGTTPNA